VKKKSKRKSTRKDQLETIEQIERAVEGMKRHRKELGDDPKWDRLIAQGEQISRNWREADEKTEQARIAHQEAKKKWDASVKEAVEKYGVRGLQQIHAHFVAMGDHEHAQIVRILLQHAQTLAKKARRDKERKKGKERDEDSED